MTRKPKKPRRPTLSYRVARLERLLLSLMDPSKKTPMWFKGFK